MMTRKASARTRFACLLLAGLAAAPVGCRRDDDIPKTIQRSGRVASINKETGIVEMWCYVPKEKKERKISGTLDPNVEILVNGAVASADDVQIDDKVTVTSRRLPRDDDVFQFVVTRVEVERPLPETVPATAPQ